MYVIHRSWDQGILGKSVRHLPEPSVLGWVRGIWNDVCDLDDACDLLIRELGTDLYGLPWLFSGGGQAPLDMRELRVLARTRIPDVYQCNVDEHSIRILANGLHHDVAYYLVDDDAVAANPGRWSFAVHDGPLPDSAAPFASRPVFTSPLDTISLTEHPPPGEGVVYAIWLTFKALRDCIGWNHTYALPGVRLTQLGAVLRDLDTSTEEWPLELEILRALVAPTENGIAAALERCNRWPTYSLSSEERPESPRSHAEALRLIEAVTPETERERLRTVIRTGEHVAQMFVHGGSELFDQWFFFDDQWAGAHPDLAASLVWFAYHWDPLCSRWHMRFTPCSDNRIRYVAVVGEDGHVRVREAEPKDAVRICDLYEWAYERRPMGDVTAGEVLGTVELQLQQPSPDMCKFTDFVITRTRRGQAVAARLARHIRHDLRAEGITRITDWLPTDYSHGRRFLRALGEIRTPSGAPEFLLIR
ncbi:GNAT family N-acetyltransferase [Nonomuraea lactucae]|uniref:GNAT family N-acetyltransferase n=1 Tax=Nonomuraea lactucae TaxID=2249762 RepID=UPI0013B394B2|nr:GNAT family N-acetyltransferase [Nonomuraea lactucae]